MLLYKQLLLMTFGTTLVERLSETLCKQVRNLLNLFCAQFPLLHISNTLKYVSHIHVYSSHIQRLIQGLYVRLQPPIVR